MLVLLFMNLTIWSIIGATDIDKYTLDALDCRFPSKIQNGLLKSVCENKGINNVNTNTTRAIILQYSDTKIIQGYRCERYYSSFYEVCGFLSHTKLFRPPTIQQAQIITPEECDRMRLQKTYQREDGSLTSITVNEVYTYQFVKHGQLHYTSDNVACEGAKVMIHGEEVSNLVELVSAEVLIKKIELEVTPTSITDLDLNMKIPQLCSHISACQAGTEAYVLEYPESACPLSVIRSVDMVPITITSEDGSQEALVDHKNKIFLTLKSREHAPSACKPVFTLYQTEYPSIKVLSEDIAMFDLSNVDHHLNPSLVDMNLEIRTSESYLTYYFQTILQAQMGDLSRKLCSINRETLNLNELSPFHQNSLLRIRGDVVQELQCKPVIATAKIGDKRSDQCSSDSLPVWIENQPLRLQARTHLIIEEDPLEMIPCNAAYVPVFLARDGHTLLTAMPEVQTIKMPLGHISSDYLHLNDEDFTHPAFGEDLLYTAEEITQFNSLIHFQRTKQRVLNSMVSSYCKGNAQCGAYQPSKSTSPVFNLQHLEDEMTSPFQFLFNWSKKVAQIGNICSILIVFIIVISTIYKFYRVLWLTCRHKLGIRQAIKMGWFVDASLLQTLISQKACNTQPSNHIGTKTPPEVMAPYLDMVSSTAPERIPLNDHATTTTRPSSMCNTATSAHLESTSLSPTVFNTVSKTNEEPWY